MKNKCELLPGFEALGLALFIKPEKTLVFSDTHLGFEEELKSVGFMLPKFQYKEIKNYLRKVLARVEKKEEIERIIVNGDLKHVFGDINRQEWDEVTDLIDFLKLHCKKLVLIKGNHDTILAPIAKKMGVDLVDHVYLKKQGIYIAHGHKIDKNKDIAAAKTLIIGHGHPALALTDSVRTEKVKCFLVGRWKNKKLIQMPSLNFITAGSDVLYEGMFSPFLEKNAKDLEVFGVEGFEVLNFGKLSSISDVLDVKS
jgi:putative SbcD/Mre11-related phosphoesterase